MRIVSRIQWGSQPLLERLDKRGIKAKLVKDGIVIELPSSPSAQGLRYEVIDEVKSNPLFIDVSEEGGLGGKSKAGVVVCGLGGKPLRPYRRPRRVTSCGASARFSAPMVVATVTAYCDDHRIAIREHRIASDGKFAWIESDILWGGEIKPIGWRCVCGIFLDESTKNPGEHTHPQNGKRCRSKLTLVHTRLPQGTKRFLGAVIAAKDKALCHHCRCVHFAK